MIEAIVRAENPTFLTLETEREGKRVKEKLKVGGDYPQGEFAEQVFKSFGLMHIVAPFLPDVIKADFPVLEMAMKLTGQMYASEGRKAPTWDIPGNVVAIPHTKTGRGTIVTYSGGKDSMWNWLQSLKMGEDSMAVHIKGLNQSVADREYRDVLKQQEKIGFPLTVIELKNSKSQRGYKSMRSRDPFLTALTIPIALEFSANKVLLEGSFLEGAEAEGQAFSYIKSTWDTYNALLINAGLDLAMVGTDRGEIDSIRDLLEQKSEWMPLVSNCFSMKVFQVQIARKLKEAAPTTPLYESQCGRCLKCRTVTLTRMMYDPAMESMSMEDKVFYLEDTKRWLKSKYKEVKDIMDPGFLELLSKLNERYSR